MREALEELRPPAGDELRALQTRVDSLEARVRELESRRRPARASASGQAPAKSASRAKSTSRAKSASKPAARRASKSG